MVAHLKAKGWTITDVGVKSPDDNDTDLMFHRIGLRVGSLIAEGEFECALVFCGTGMGIHIAASKCPHVHAGVVESVPAALRAITGNGVNVLAMGAFYVAPQMGCDIADAYLGAQLGSGYEWWHNFYESHKLAIDELEAFDYETYKKNGFQAQASGRLRPQAGDQTGGLTAFIPYRRAATETFRIFPSGARPFKNPRVFYARIFSRGNTAVHINLLCRVLLFFSRALYLPDAEI